MPFCLENPSELRTFLDKASKGIFLLLFFIFLFYCGTGEHASEKFFTERRRSQCVQIQMYPKQISIYLGLVTYRKQLQFLMSSKGARKYHGLFSPTTKKEYIKDVVYYTFDVLSFAGILQFYLQEVI